jgi:prolyl-tRNA synthetase
MWCGELACEEEIKEKFGVTSRCMPFEQEQISSTCVCCGKPAKKMVYWGKSY